MITAEQARELCEQGKQKLEKIFDEYFDNTLAEIFEKDIISACNEGKNSAWITIPHLNDLPFIKFNSLLRNKMRTYDYFISENDDPVACGYSAIYNAYMYNYFISW